MTETASSLIRELPEHLLSRIEGSTADVQSRVKSLETVLSGQIKHYIQLRIQELTNFAEHALQQQRQDQLRKKQQDSDATQALNRPPLKSVLKRRPSNGEKHVTFSSEPPQVECIDDDDENDGDDDGVENESASKNRNENGDDNASSGSNSGALRGSESSSNPAISDTDSSSPAASLGNEVVLYHHKEGMPELKAGRDFKLSVRQLPVNASESPRSPRSPRSPQSESRGSTSAVPKSEDSMSDVASDGILSDGDDRLSDLSDFDDDSAGYKGSSVDPRIRSATEFDEPRLDYTVSTMKPAEPSCDDSDEDRTPPSLVEDTSHSTEPQFSFDDVMNEGRSSDDEQEEEEEEEEGDDEEGGSVEGSNFTGTEPIGTPTTRSAHPPISNLTSNLQSFVGSAPININLPEHMSTVHGGLAWDGGLRSVNKDDPHGPLEADQDLPPSIPSSPPPNLNALDPANMSFSQRMAWEDYRHK